MKTKKYKRKQIKTKRKKLNKKYNKKRSFKKYQKQIGGYNSEEIVILNNNGLSNYHIQHLEDLGLTFQQINDKITEIINRDENGFYGNSDEIADMVVQELQNEIMNQTIPMEENDIHSINTDDTMASLHLSDLNISENGFTSEEDMSIDGGKKKSTRRKYKKGGKGMTDTITTEPYGYKEDEYDQLKNALNYK